MRSDKEKFYYIISLGCSKNLVDSERVNGSLANAGFTPADSPEDAGIIIVNTCGFIEAAKEESIETIFDAVNSDEKKKVAVIGCLAQRYRDELADEIPEIDFIYGVPDDGFVEKFSETFAGSGEKIPLIERKPLVGPLPYSYIKISEGCSNNCSYCAIPLIRGPQKSFSPEAILTDVKSAVSGGAVEMNIVAQDISQYGYAGIKLHHLIKKISLVDEVKWIRLLYCHPDHIDDTIINVIETNEKVVRYIDIPFQHVSGSILESMGRKGDYSRYLDLVKKLRDHIPGLAIRSTFMVGYPGETENDFDLMIKFLEEANLEKAGCFAYSREEGTAAGELSGQVPERIMKQRLDCFMDTQKKISEKKLDDMVGRKVEVLIEGKLDEQTCFGRSEFDAPEVDGIFYLTLSGGANNKTGMRPVAGTEIVTARVTGSTEYDLIGEII